jgi:hypothetical protein
MSIHARCLCGPPRGLPAIQVQDAARFDPTGTSAIRSKFKSDMDMRWNRLKKLTAAAVGKYGQSSVEMIQHSIVTGDDPILAFQTWLDEALRQVVLGYDGSWTAKYVRGAADAGSKHAFANAPTDATPADRTPALQSLTVTELQGIAEAVSQQCVRAFGNGLMTHAKPTSIAQATSVVIDKVGKSRGRALAEFMVVRAHAAATLDAFRAAGISHVGTVAERVRPVSPPDDLTRDAKKRKHNLKGLYNVLTAADDEVCFRCQEASDDSPYTLDEAEELVPLHINCRCALVPADDRRFASVRDAYDPDESVARK